MCEKSRISEGNPPDSGGRIQLKESLRVEHGRSEECTTFVQSEGNGSGPTTSAVENPDMNKVIHRTCEIPASSIRARACERSGCVKWIRLKGGPENTKSLQFPFRFLYHHRAADDKAAEKLIVDGYKYNFWT